ncbi:hypothetical protein SNEBB_004513 [Seison nebaliae]|nr:hypothetical protein SNEBB_004513 [Seison nebaliae]
MIRKNINSNFTESNRTEYRACHINLLILTNELPNVESTPHERHKRFYSAMSMLSNMLFPKNKKKSSSTKDAVLDRVQNQQELTAKHVTMMNNMLKLKQEKTLFQHTEYAYISALNDVIDAGLEKILLNTKESCSRISIQGTQSLLSVIGAVTQTLSVIEMETRRFAQSQKPPDIEPSESEIYNEMEQQVEEEINADIIHKMKQKDETVRDLKENIKIAQKTENLLQNVLVSKENLENEKYDNQLHLIDGSEENFHQ